MEPPAEQEELIKHGDELLHKNQGKTFGVINEQFKPRILRVSPFFSPGTQQPAEHIISVQSEQNDFAPHKWDVRSLSGRRHFLPGSGSTQRPYVQRSKVHKGASFLPVIDVKYQRRLKSRSSRWKRKTKESSPSVASMADSSDYTLDRPSPGPLTSALTTMPGSMALNSMIFGSQTSVEGTPHPEKNPWVGRSFRWTGESKTRGLAGQEQSEPGGDGSAQEERYPPVTAGHYSTENPLYFDSPVKLTHPNLSDFSSSVPPSSNWNVRSSYDPSNEMSGRGHFLPGSGSTQRPYVQRSRVHKGASFRTPATSPQFPPVIGVKHESKLKSHSSRWKKKTEESSYSVASTADSSDYTLDRPSPGPLRETGLIKTPSTAPDATQRHSQDNTRAIELHATAGPSTLHPLTKDNKDSVSASFYDREKGDELSGSTVDFHDTLPGRITLNSPRFLSYESRIRPDLPLLSPELQQQRNKHITSTQSAQNYVRPQHQQSLEPPGLSYNQLSYMFPVYSRRMEGEIVEKMDQTEHTPTVHRPHRRYSARSDPLSSYYSNQTALTTMPGSMALNSTTYGSQTSVEGTPHPEKNPWVGRSFRWTGEGKTRGLAGQEQSEPGGDGSAQEERFPPVTAGHYSTENPLYFDSPDKLTHPNLSDFSSFVLPSSNWNVRSSYDPSNEMSGRGHFLPGSGSTQRPYVQRSWVHKGATFRTPATSPQFPPVIGKKHERKLKIHSSRWKKKTEESSPGVASTADSSDYTLDRPSPGPLRETGLIKTPSTAPDATQRHSQDNTRESQLHATAGPSTLHPFTNDNKDSDSAAFYDREKGDELSGSTVGFHDTLPGRITLLSPISLGSWIRPDLPLLSPELQQQRNKHITSTQSAQNYVRPQHQQSLEPPGLSYNQLSNMFPVYSRRMEGEIVEKMDQTEHTPTVHRPHRRYSAWSDPLSSYYSNQTALTTMPGSMALNSTTSGSQTSVEGTPHPEKNPWVGRSFRWTGESKKRGLVGQEQSEPGGDGSAQEERFPPVTAGHYSTENPLYFDSPNKLTHLNLSDFTSSVSPSSYWNVRSTYDPSNEMSGRGHFLPGLGSTQRPYVQRSRVHKGASFRTPATSPQFPPVIGKKHQRKLKRRSSRWKKKTEESSPGVASTADSSDYTLDRPSPGPLRETVIKTPSTAPDATPGPSQDNTRAIELHATAGPSTRHYFMDLDDSLYDTQLLLLLDLIREHHDSLSCSPPVYTAGSGENRSEIMSVQSENPSGAKSDAKMERDTSLTAVKSLVTNTWPTESAGPFTLQLPDFRVQSPAELSDLYQELEPLDDLVSSYSSAVHTAGSGENINDTSQLLSVPSECESAGDSDPLVKMEAPVTAVKSSVTNTQPTRPHLQLSSDPGWSQRGSSCLPRSHSVPSLSQISSAENKTIRPSESLPDLLLKSSFEEFTPDITVDENDETYRFLCSCPGLYQCSVTGLVFHMEGEGDVVYRIVSWDRRLLAQHHKKPAGPLFDIKCLQQSVCRLHLPHCEIRSTAGCECLSVAHVNDEGIEFILPHKITETHVIINITGFSGFGNVKDEDSPPEPVRALVLLFYRSLSDQNLTSFLNVLMLPRNVVLRDVRRTRKKLVGDELYIETSSHCKLLPKQEYTLSTCPEDDSVLVQPKEAEFDEESSDNYFPSFQVTLKTVILNMKTFLRDTNSSHIVWEREVCLPSAGVKRPCVQGSSDQILKDVRSSFIEGISGPVLKSLLDKLFEKKVLTDAERESADEEHNRGDKARFVIDTVRRKGDAASSEMIEFLCELDPFLCKHLGLMVT